MTYGETQSTWPVEWSPLVYQERYRCLSACVCTSVYTRVHAVYKLYIVPDADSTDADSLANN